MPKTYKKGDVLRSVLSERAAARSAPLLWGFLCALLAPNVIAQADTPAKPQEAIAHINPLAPTAAPVSNTPLSAAEDLAWSIYRRDNGTDSVARGTMSLVSANGRTRTRDLSIFQRDAADGQATTLIRFSSPASISGTALLDSPESEGMWIYLPALDRARRISNSNGGGRFVNSQYFYEDLGERHPDKDEHSLGERGNYEGVETLVLISKPVDGDDSVYSARKSWIHPELLLPLRIDFYEDDVEPSKRLEVLRIDEVQGYWTVMASRMIDLHTMDTTTITVNAIEYNQDLPQSLFNTSTLGVRDAFLPYVP